ncbi:MAG: hypothetical protein MJ252_25485 [archaeon]|nr:hypothetical protein [archaeon]
MIYYLLIVNKNGSLIFEKKLNENLKLSSNETINSASIFYSLHAISSKLTPPCLEKSSELKLENNGIELIETNSIKVICFQTLTKIKFIFVTDTNTTIDACREYYKNIYNIYSDIVSKNPFYELDMPIRLEAFDQEIAKLFH